MELCFKPHGAAEMQMSGRPYGTRFHFVHEPAVETAGYFHPSLRDLEELHFWNAAATQINSRPQFFWIIALHNKLADALDDLRAVFAIRHTEPRIG